MSTTPNDGKPLKWLVVRIKPVSIACMAGAKKAERFTVRGVLGKNVKRGRGSGRGRLSEVPLPLFLLGLPLMRMSILGSVATCNNNTPRLVV